MTRLYHATAVVFIVTLAVLAAPGVGQADRMRGGGRGHMMGMDVMSQLSAEEQKTVQELVPTYQQTMMDLMKKIFAKRAELNAVMAQEKFDGTKARALGKELVNLHGQLMEQHLGMFIEMREKGVSYYGTCMTGGMMGRGMMMDGGMMMPQDMMQTEAE